MRWREGEGGGGGWREGGGRGGGGRGGGGEAHWKAELLNDSSILPGS